MHFEEDDDVDLFIVLKYSVLSRSVVPSSNAHRKQMRSVKTLCLEFNTMQSTLCF